MTKIKLDLTFSIKDLEGTVIPNTDVNKLIANILAGGISKDKAAMAMRLAVDMYKEKVIEVSNAELNFIKDSIAEANITNLAKAQIEEYLQSVNK